MKVDIIKDYIKILNIADKYKEIDKTMFKIKEMAVKEIIKNTFRKVVKWKWD